MLIQSQFLYHFTISRTYTKSKILLQIYLQRSYNLKGRYITGLLIIRSAAIIEIAGAAVEDQPGKDVQTDLV